MLGTQDSFYITLPSNSNPDIFPKNKPQSFKVNFSTPLILDGKWKVGLTEIQYPNNWYNIPENSSFSIFFNKPRMYPNISLTIYESTPGIKATLILKNSENDRLKSYIEEEEKFQKSKNAADKKLQIKEFIVNVPAGNYVSLDALCLKIQECIKNVLDFQYVPNEVDRNEPIEVRRTRRGLVNIDSIGKEVYIKVNNGNKLWQYLGFLDEKQDVFYHLPVTSDFSPNLLLQNPSIYVYCDVVQHQRVGNILAPLLRVVPIEGKSGEYIWKQFIKPMYLDVNKGYISTIEVELRDDTGKLIIFGAGKVLVVLEFKRVSW